MQSGQTIGTTRRRKIQEAIFTTQTALPHLTDWVLWTRHALTKRDQEWFEAIPSSFRLHLWTSDNIETLLSGNGEIFRHTYFGDLVLSPAVLAENHERSVAYVKKRWMPEVHQTVSAERKIRRMLGEAEAWCELVGLSNTIHKAVGEITSQRPAIAHQLNSRVDAFIDTANDIAALGNEVLGLLRKGDFEALRERLQNIPTLAKEVAIVPNSLRGARLACGLIATNALEDMRACIGIFGRISDEVTTRMISVIADAGGGKTQLSAQLSSQSCDRPAGVFISGRELHSGRGLDELARAFSIHAHPVASMESLVAAVDAVGRRCGRRLPIVIDGLNEAEDPRQWKPLLAALDALLRSFANVMVVCTLRTGARRPIEQDWQYIQSGDDELRLGFAKESLPDEMPRLEMDGFEEDAESAISRYFEYFKINRGDVELRIELLRHPLTLRLFCEVSNPDRRVYVGVGAMPRSLTGLFEKFLELAAERIRDLSPRTRRYYEQDVRKVLDIIGALLWSTNSRELLEEQVRVAVGDESRPWNESIIHLLEQEGVILRMSRENGQKAIIPIYDALGGHLIAASLTAMHGRTDLVKWLKEKKTIKALSFGNRKCHPLAEDVFKSLVSLVPRRLNRQQLWQLLDGHLQSIALRMTTELEGRYLDGVTVTEVASRLGRISKPSSVFRDLFDCRSAIDHPFNSEFLDRVLSGNAVANRDTTWTEWLRSNLEWLREDVLKLESGWRSDLSNRSRLDYLRARWLMWLLTSTARRLRDMVTQALYWFGRGSPRDLFELTIESLSINDLYVRERMLAASYGIAMAIRGTPYPSVAELKALKDFGTRTFQLMFDDVASNRTTHVIAREFARRIIEVAGFFDKTLFTREQFSRTRPPYENGGQLSWADAKDQDDDHGVGQTLKMDFENYTLGRLVEDRGNYDYEHDGYRDVRAKILWRIAGLGWNAETFYDIDEAIASRNSFSRMGSDPHKIDRYGKKYSWIAYFELTGWLSDTGKLDRHDEDGRSLELSIDPSFPEKGDSLPVIRKNYLDDYTGSLQEWIKSGPAPNLRSALRQKKLDGHDGPWIALDGYLTQHNEQTGRQLFAFVRSFLVKSEEAATIYKLLVAQPLQGRWLPEKPSVHSALAGEMPWCDSFPPTDFQKLAFVTRTESREVTEKDVEFWFDGCKLDFGNLTPELEKEIKSLLDGNASRIEVREVCTTRTIHDKVVKEFVVWSPVVDFEFSPEDADENVSRVMLSRDMARLTNLFHVPQTYDLRSKDGRRATFSSAAGDRFDNSQRFLYVRRDVLEAILKRYNAKLIWAIWGEREVSYKFFEQLRTSTMAESNLRGDFQAIYKL